MIKRRQFHIFLRCVGLYGFGLTLYFIKSSSIFSQHSEQSACSDFKPNSPNSLQDIQDKPKIPVCHLYTLI